METPPQFGNVFLADLHIQVRPKTREAAPRHVPGFLLQKTDEGEDLPLPARGKFAELFQYLFFDGHCAILVACANCTAHGEASRSDACRCAPSNLFPVIWYNVAIMMSRTQITLESQIHRRARQRASEMGVSLAEYMRRLVARDLARPQAKVEVSCVFDLGNSGGSDVARNKDSMVAQAFNSARKSRRLSTIRP